MPKLSSPPLPPRPAPPTIKLHPWISTSPSHLQRMRQQRQACGWNADAVDAWAAQQAAGTMAMFWVVLTEDGEVDGAVDLLRRHREMFPAEALGLRVNSDGDEEGGDDDGGVVMIVPVGHVALVQAPSEPAAAAAASESASGSKLAAPSSRPVLAISSLYVSPAVRGHRLGDQTMDAIEAVARRGVSALLPAAEELRLWTVEGAAQGDLERRAALGLQEGDGDVVVVLQAWYERRGYVVFGREEGRFDRVDEGGRVWRAAAVGMSLQLR